MEDQDIREVLATYPHRMLIELYMRSIRRTEDPVPSDRLVRMADVANEELVVRSERIIEMCSLIAEQAELRFLQDNSVVYERLIELLMDGHKLSINTYPISGWVVLLDGKATPLSDWIAQQEALLRSEVSQ